MNIVLFSHGGGLEIQLGKVLGRGGFCVVKEVTKISLLKTNNGSNAAITGSGNRQDEHFIHNIVQDRGFMAEHCIRKGKDYRYAVKKVQDSSRDDAQIFVNAVVDLAIEARFLAVVRHPNIIKMRAMYDGSPYKNEFFVVLDKLFDIMPGRIKKWKKQSGSGLKGMFKSKKVKQAFWVERLTVAYDIACALSYLHGLKYVPCWVSFPLSSGLLHIQYKLLLLTGAFLYVCFPCSVIYRDLKPDNLVSANWCLVLY